MESWEISDGSGESLRPRIHHKLEAPIGTEEADALVTHAFPAPGQEIATKDDLRVVQADLCVVRADLRVVAAELRTEIAGLRGEMLETKGELHGEIASVRGEIHSVVVTQARWMIAFIMSWSAVVLAAAKLLF